jgi:hypothetical protein
MIGLDGTESASQRVLSMRSCSAKSQEKIWYMDWTMMRSSNWVLRAQFSVVKFKVRFVICEENVCNVPELLSHDNAIALSCYCDYIEVL